METRYTLEFLRKRAGISSGDFAAMLGLSISHYSHIEHGRKNVPHAKLAKLAEILSVSPEQIIFGEEDKSEVKETYKNNPIFLKVQGLTILELFKQNLSFERKGEEFSEGQLLWEFEMFISEILSREILKEIVGNEKLKKFVIEYISKQNKD